MGAAAQSEYNNRGYAVSDDVTNNVTVADLFNGDRGVQARTPYRGNSISSELHERGWGSAMVVHANGNCGESSSVSGSGGSNGDSSQRHRSR